MKLRATYTVTFDYEPEPCCYPDGSDIEKIKRIDKVSMMTCRYDFVRDRDAKWSIDISEIEETNVS